MQSYIIIYFFWVIGTSSAAHIPSRPREPCECGVLAHDGVLTSPLYPNRYPNNMSCTWQIVQAPGRRIGVEITNSQFEFEFKDKVSGKNFCQNDYLELSTMDGTRRRRFCGYNTLGRLELDTNEGMLTFRSDERNAFRGWRLKYFGVVDGNWTPWYEWGLCDRGCGNGIRERVRQCWNPPPENGGRKCRGPFKQRGECFTKQFCPIHGSWSDWEEWMSCDRTYNGGTQTRRHLCNSPEPKHDGNECRGYSLDHRPCINNPYPIDGGWSPWTATESSQCSATCGEGTEAVVRYCNSPKPQNGGAPCTGDDKKMEACFLRRCEGSNQWADWSLAPCDKSCGGGVKRSVRYCIDSETLSHSYGCLGNAKLFMEVMHHCNDNPCPIDGGLSDWTDWTSCTATCGKSLQRRSRSCSSPTPKHGGAACSGVLYEEKTCSRKSCPVDGQWSVWLAWSDCSVTCGMGYQMRTRYCEGYDNVRCLGQYMETQTCTDIASCAVDGGWASWLAWSACTKTCGGGTHNRHRSCTEPAPDNRGRECVGDSFQQEECSTDRCPEVDGAWANWSDWSACDVSCGSAVQSRTRTCSNPPPLNGGLYCTGRSFANRKCDLPEC